MGYSCYFLNWITKPTLTTRKLVGSKLRALCKFKSMCASLFYHLRKLVSSYFTEMTITILVEKFKLILTSMISQWKTNKKNFISLLFAYVLWLTNVSPCVSFSSHIESIMTSYSDFSHIRLLLLTAFTKKTCQAHNFNVPQIFILYSP